MGGSGPLTGTRTVNVHGARPSTVGIELRSSSNVASRSRTPTPAPSPQTSTHPPDPFPDHRIVARLRSSTRHREGLYSDPSQASARRTSLNGMAPTPCPSSNRCECSLTLNRLNLPLKLPVIVMPSKAAARLVTASVICSNVAEQGALGILGELVQVAHAQLRLNLHLQLFAGLGRRFGEQPLPLLGNQYAAMPRTAWDCIANGLTDAGFSTSRIWLSSKAGSSRPKKPSCAMRCAAGVSSNPITRLRSPHR